MTILRIAALSAFATMLLPDAHAGACDYLVDGAKHLQGQAVINGFNTLVSCDKELAKRHYSAFMQQATDLEVLVPLSHAAIDAEVWNPVWEMIGKISDYGMRDEVATSIGSLCAEDPKVVGFLKGGYFALRDIEFQQWDNALANCESDDFEAWLAESLTNPPKTSYDEKWSTLGRASIERNGTDALGDLTTAAIAAGNNEGPFESALTLMEEAIAQDFGDPNPEDVKLLNEALLKVAAAIPAASARSIADRLLNAGDEAAAATLLPTIYGDRVQSGGKFLYGAVSVEDCADKQEAYIHGAVITEDGSRYIVQSAIEGPMRSTFKSKLGKKCELTDPWPVAITDEPMKKSGDLDALISKVTKEWEDKGYSVKSTAEKGISL